MKRMLIVWMIAICVCVLEACAGAETEYDLVDTLNEGRTVAHLKKPEGFTQMEENVEIENAGYFFRHESLGETGYAYVGIANGDYKNAAENGLATMESALSAKCESAVTESEVGTYKLVYYVISFVYENQDESGEYVSRILSAYVPVDEECSVMILISASANKEEELCEETRLLQNMEELVNKLNIVED